jgi:hypothetical protein
MWLNLSKQDFQDKVQVVILILITHRLKLIIEIQLIVNLHLLKLLFIMLL